MNLFIFCHNLSRSGTRILETSLISWKRSLKTKKSGQWLLGAESPTMVIFEIFERRVSRSRNTCFLRYSAWQLCILNIKNMECLQNCAERKINSQLTYLVKHNQHRENTNKKIIKVMTYQHDNVMLMPILYVMGSWYDTIPYIPVSLKQSLN